MGILCVVRSPLSRSILAQPFHITKRTKFSGRPAKTDTPDTRLLPSTPARTRFAPSPTGYLHLGSLRTALYNYLLAKATGGQFLLRVEDTDRARVVPDAETKLYADLKWSGLSWDEGPDVGGPSGPYRQSERLDLYTKFSTKLLNEGRAYRCFCKPEDIDLMKKASIAEGAAPVYDSKCSHVSPAESDRRAGNGEPHCIRFKIGNEKLAVHDLVYGRYTRPEKDEDFIIIKRDGYPTYHFANVIDDHLMEITHVIRGAEWLVSTPRHVALYEAFSWKTPEFAHVGLLTDINKQKLSKRHGGVELESWKDKGTLPIALLNYVMLLGWSQGKVEQGASEVMDLKDMIDKFHLKFTKGNITVNNKYQFLQAEHFKRLLEKRHNSEEVYTQLLCPLETYISKIEYARRQHVQSLTADQSPVQEDLSTRIGALVPNAAPQDAGDTVVSRAYLKALLNTDAKASRDPKYFVERGLYTLWSIPDAVYEASLRRILAELDGPQTSVESNTGLSYAELTRKLRERLQGVENERWIAKTLHDEIMTYVKMAFAAVEHGPQEFALEQDKSVYKFLRWIMTASNPNSSFWNHWELLGKEEVLRRVEQALKAAERVEQESHGSKA
ncbi:hypothetical protein F5Y15DRAFT_429643 [Xylariaceae sp. FL0016]|nr:hypothetical protein F5Y15DRAFT_429643 [Xylariaceae sp. FL0016]